MINQFIGGATWFRFLNNCADQGRSSQGVTGEVRRVTGAVGQSLQGLRGTFSGSLGGFSGETAVGEWGM